MNKICTLLILFLALTCNLTFGQTETNAHQTSELPYNYSNTTSIPIQLTIVEEISTKDEITEGQDIQFKVAKDVFYNNKYIVKQGDIITAKLETIITAGMNGFPAEIIVDRFEIPTIHQTNLLSTYTKKGQSRVYWVYPLKWALTPIPGVGSLTNFIFGGHAKIRTKDKITIYYFPNW